MFESSDVETNPDGQVSGWRLSVCPALLDIVRTVAGRLIYLFQNIRDEARTLEDRVLYGALIPLFRRSVFEPGNSLLGQCEKNNDGVCAAVSVRVFPHVRDELSSPIIRGWFQ